MFNWFWKWLRYHVCEEFTQWQTYQADLIRPTNYDIDGMIALRKDEIVYTKRWQERKCTICGKVEQRDLRVG